DSHGDRSVGRVTGDGRRACGRSVDVKGHGLPAPCGRHMVPVGVGDSARRDRVLRSLIVGPEMKVVGAAIKIEIVVPNVGAIGFGNDAAIIVQCAAFDPSGEGDVTGDPETGTVGDVNVVVHAVEAQGIAAPTRDPSC